MYLPPVPKKLNKVLPWAQKVTEYLKQITPRSSNRVKVNQTPGGTTFSEKPDLYIKPYHFQMILDPDFTPVSTEAQIAIRGGYVIAAGGPDDEEDFTISANGDTGAASEEIDNLAISDTTLAAGLTWYLWLQLYSTRVSGMYPLDLQNTELRVVISTSPPSWQVTGREPSGFKYLGSITNDGGDVTFDQHWKGGNVRMFVMLADGHAWSASPPTPRVESLDFIDHASAPADLYGHLQDRAAWERIINDADVADVSGDEVMAFFNYAPAGVTQKDYCRIDGSGGRTSSSLETVSNVLGLYDFIAGVASTPTDPATFFGNNPVLVRNDGGAYPILEYADLSGMPWSPWADCSEFETDCYGGDICTYLDGACGFITGIYHDQTDPGASGSPHANWPSSTNPDHDPRYYRLGQDYTYAYGEGIGYRSGANGSPGSGVTERIDLAGKLVDGATDHLDWISHILYLDWTGTGSFATADEITADSGGTYQAIIGDVVNGRAGTFSEYIYLTDGNWIAHIGNDGSARIGYFNDGAGNIVTLSGNDTFPCIVEGGSYDTDVGYAVLGTQVLIQQQPPITMPAITGAARDGAARQAIVDIYTMLQTHGMVQ